MVYFQLHFFYLILLGASQYVFFGNFQQAMSSVSVVLLALDFYLDPLAWVNTYSSVEKYSLIEFKYDAIHTFHVIKKCRTWHTFLEPLFCCMLDG